MQINKLSDDFNIDSVLKEDETITNKNACPDAFVGILNKGRFNPMKKKKIDYDNLGDNLETCIIVLESPHKDEFENGGTGVGIAPAEGDTGDNFNGMFNTLIKESYI